MRPFLRRDESLICAADSAFQPDRVDVGLSPELVFPSGAFPWPLPSPGAAPGGTAERSISVPLVTSNVVVAGGSFVGRAESSLQASAASTNSASIAPTTNLPTALLCVMSVVYPMQRFGKRSIPIEHTLRVLDLTAALAACSVAVRRGLRRERCPWLWLQ